MYDFSCSLGRGFVAAAVVFTCVGVTAAAEVRPAMALTSGDKVEVAGRAAYREFGKAKVAEASKPERFVFRFHEAVKLGEVSASGEFKVTGGDCAAGRSYLPGEACSVEVAFMPNGPGHRTGILKMAPAVVGAAEVKPLLTPIGGTGYAPAISFTPSLIQTVAGTNLGGTTGGLISGPGQLATDGGDNLYIADPGNHLIRFRDSSGVLKTLIGGGTTSLLTSSATGPGTKLNTPIGVAVDYTGTVYFDDNADKILGSYYIDNIAVGTVGGGTASELTCNPSAPCNPNAVALSPPTTLSVDSSGNIFFAATYGNGLPGSTLSEYTAEASSVQVYLVETTAYNYYSSGNAVIPDPFGYGNLYYTYLDPGSAELSPTPLCYILAQNYAYSQGSSSGRRFWEVAGDGQCGFSGDGGKATGAEISKAIGQFAWDAAGNFYFTDTGNNRVRRVDAVSGIIRTIAGSGSAGSNGDGAESTMAQLQAPIGLATDSTGRVYATGITGAANKYDIRMFGSQGQLNFPATVIGTHAAAQTVLVSNVGNAELNFTHVAFTGGFTSDFAIDANTTSCNFTAPLPSGHSCNVGVIFTPSGSGSRYATLSLLDDTANGVDSIQVYGPGATVAKAVLAPTTLAFAAQKVATSSAAKVLTLTNAGGVALTINSYAITGTNAADFTQSHSCGATLAGGASCTISVAFKPAAVGARTATLAVATSAGTVTNALSGTGAAAAVKPKVVLASKANPVAMGQAVVMTSTVAGATGIVQLKEDGKVLAAGTLSKGVVTFKVTGLAAGTHLLGAQYLGDKTHAGANSAVVKQMVALEIDAPKVARLGWH